ncbi:MAG: crotonase/enoyl-CoA hydratase family protein [Rubrivivax sp.]|nr:crotonase/enoyl-CoA hydratase family protein [Rubrivivax sp.]
MNTTPSDLLAAERDGPVLHLALNRPAKRNAVNDGLILALRAAFETLAEDVRCVLLSGNGEHFCAGLDLSELAERSTFEGVAHSRMWHAALDQLQYARVPVVAVLHGAVVGGGLEVACAAHLRVAERSAFYALPEGQRGLFVGGGGSVRVPRLIGVARMADMMLTGRVLDADEGQQLGLSTYLVDDGEGLAKGRALAHKIAGNAPVTNFAIVQALPRIADAAPADGLFMESLVAAIAQGEPAAKERMRAFLDKRAGKVGKS